MPISDWSAILQSVKGFPLHYTGQTHLLVQQMGPVKRFWYLSPMRAAKVQASLRIRAVSPEPSLLAHTSSESRGTFRQKTRSLAPLNGWACAVEMCHDGMLEDTNSLDGAQMMYQCSLLALAPKEMRKIESKTKMPTTTTTTTATTTTAAATKN